MTNSGNDMGYLFKLHNTIQYHLWQILSLETSINQHGATSSGPTSGVRPQLMHSKLNSKNAVGITEKCRSQTNCAVVRLKATFSAKSAVFEVLGCSRYIYFTCSSVHSWESAEFLYMSDSSYSPPKKSGVRISFLPTCSMVLEYWPTFALKIAQFCR